MTHTSGTTKESKMSRVTRNTKIEADGVVYQIIKGMSHITVVVADRAEA